MSFTKRKKKLARFDKRRIKFYCTATFDQIADEIGAQQAMTPDGLRMAYADRGGDVLAVAHLDIVRGLVPHQQQFRARRSKVYSVALDDRLGAYLICEYLPKLGLNYDILLTDGEEIGMSTAQYFDPAHFGNKGKQYNWIFEFDRSGGDVVMYQYHDDDTETLLWNSGFIVGRGSFTDICELEHLGCKAFNFGTGYSREHTKACFADLRITAKMAALFVDFFKDHAETLLEHEPFSGYSDPYMGHYYGKAYGRKAYDAYGGHLDGRFGETDEDWLDGGDWRREDDGEKPIPASYEDFSWMLYEDTRNWIMGEYGLDLDAMTFDDYCKLMTVDQNDALSWADRDFAVYDAIG